MSYSDNWTCRCFDVSIYNNEKIINTSDEKTKPVNKHTHLKRNYKTSCLRVFPCLIKWQWKYWFIDISPLKHKRTFSFFSAGGKKKWGGKRRDNTHFFTAQQNMIHLLCLFWLVSGGNVMWNVFMKIMQELMKWDFWHFFKTSQCVHRICSQFLFFY